MNHIVFFKSHIFREADCIIGCCDGEVFIDFSFVNTQVCITRISFDGYGCCEIKNKKYLNCEISKSFLEEISKEKMNQDLIRNIIKKAVEMNKKSIWMDALQEYKLI